MNYGWMAQQSQGFGSYGSGFGSNSTATSSYTNPYQSWQQGGSGVGSAGSVTNGSFYGGAAPQNAGCGAGAGWSPSTWGQQQQQQSQTQQASPFGSAFGQSATVTNSTAPSPSPYHSWQSYGQASDSSFSGTVTSSTLPNTTTPACPEQTPQYTGFSLPPRRMREVTPDASARPPSRDGSISSNGVTSESRSCSRSSSCTPSTGSSTESHEQSFVTSPTSAPRASMFAPDPAQHQEQTFPTPKFKLPCVSEAIVRDNGGPQKTGSSLGLQEAIAAIRASLPQGAPPLDLSRTIRIGCGGGSSHVIRVPTARPHTYGGGSHPKEVVIKFAGPEVHQAAFKLECDTHCGISKSDTAGSVPGFLGCANTTTAHGVPFGFVITPLAEFGDLDSPDTKEKVGADSALLAKVLQGLLESLRHIHACNYVHRDVKPANILLAADHDSGEESSIKALLTDFGFCTTLDLAAKSRIPNPGTMGYTPPEVLCGEGAGQAGDVWAAGAVLAELMDQAVRPLAHGKSPEHYQPFMDQIHLLSLQLGAPTDTFVQRFCPTGWAGGNSQPDGPSPEIRKLSRGCGVREAISLAGASRTRGEGVRGWSQEFASRVAARKDTPISSWATGEEGGYDRRACLGTLLEKMLRWDPNERPTSAQLLAEGATMGLW